jgi:hypothetical protein
MIATIHQVRLKHIHSCRCVDRFSAFLGIALRGGIGSPVPRGQILFVAQSTTYQVVSIAGNVAVTQLGDKPNLGVHVRLQKSIFQVSSGERAETILSLRAMTGRNTNITSPARTAAGRVLSSNFLRSAD